MDSLRNNGGFSDEDAHAGVELNLGLSLNGRFGMDRSKDGFRIDRSWSLQSCSSVGGGGSSSSRFLTPAVAVTKPARTYSLPSVAAAVNWRKRKGGADDESLGGIRRKNDKMMSPRIGRAGDDSKANGDGDGGEAVGSQSRASSSAISSAALPFQAQGKGKNESKPPRHGLIPTPTAEKKSLTVKMPTVTTVGIGPGGRKVNGILYKYDRGEEVKILCVCHGYFLSPAEFIRHAGGEAVGNPLQSITVMTHEPDCFVTHTFKKFCN